MAEKRASKKKSAAPSKAKAPAYSFRTYGDTAGGFLFALVRGKDGATLMYADAGRPYKSLKAAQTAIAEVVLAIQGGNVPLLKSTD